MVQDKVHTSKAKPMPLPPHRNRISRMGFSTFFRVRVGHKKELKSRKKFLTYHAKCGFVPPSSHGV